MPLAEKKCHIKKERKLISVAAEDASEILAYAKEKDPEAILWRLSAAIMI